MKKERRERHAIYIKHTVNKVKEYYLLNIHIKLTSIYKLIRAGTLKIHIHERTQTQIRRRAQAYTCGDVYIYIDTYLYVYVDAYMRILRNTHKNTFAQKYIDTKIQP